MSIFFRSLVAMIVTAMFTFVLASSTPVSAQQGVRPGDKRYRDLAVGQVRQYLLKPSDSSISSRVTKIEPSVNGPQGLDLAGDWQDIDGSVLVTVTTNSDAKVNALGESTPFVLDLIDGNGYLLESIRVDVPIHIGMPAELLSATGKFGGSGRSIRTAPYFKFDPTDLRVQVIQSGEVVFPSSQGAKRDPIGSSLRILTKELKSTGWQVVDSKTNSKLAVDVPIQILDERFQADIVGKLADDKTVYFQASRDGFQIIGVIWTDAITGRPRFLVAFDEPRLE
ncbi:MAG: hypothetical protein IT410_02060 [Candidatus Doudnabacteria bacterium]|nr:hypothetical protein [Candidatus Doudnabacteria bacterium]